MNTHKHTLHFIYMDCVFQDNTHETYTPTRTPMFVDTVDTRNVIDIFTQTEDDDQSESDNAHSDSGSDDDDDDEPPPLPPSDDEEEDHGKSNIQEAAHFVNQYFCYRFEWWQAQ